MASLPPLLPLVGVLIIVAGFLRRVNPLLVVAVAAVATGLAAGQSPRAVLATLGHAFIENRYVAIVWLVVPAIGLLEAAGLKEHARALVARLRGAAPMVEGAAGAVDEATRERLRAHAAAADNIGLFFGEDVFIAIGSILLIKGVLEQNGVRVEPAHVALWAVPTALAALAVHGARVLLLDRRLARARRGAP